MPTLRIHTHWQVAQSFPAIQNLPKSMAARTHGQKDSAAKIKDRLTNDKNGQLVTCGIFYCRDCAEINGGGSLQTSSWLVSEVLRNRQQKHTAIRYAQAEKRQRHSKLTMKMEY